jgi:hypothetical protein
MPSRLVSATWHSRHRPPSSGLLRLPGESGLTPEELAQLYLPNLPAYTLGELLGPIFVGEALFGGFFADVRKVAIRRYAGKLPPFSRT